MERSAQCICYFYRVCSFSVWVGRWWWGFNCSSSSQGTASRRMLWITVHLWLVDSLLPTVSQWIRQLTSALWVLPRVLSFSLPVFFQHALFLLNFTHRYFSNAHRHTYKYFSLSLFWSSPLIQTYLSYFFIHTACTVQQHTDTHTHTHSCRRLTHEHTDLFTQFTRQLIFKALLHWSLFFLEKLFKRKKKKSGD